MWKKLRESVKVLYQNKCCLCGINNWMGEPLTLQVDHIDGNRKNNDMNNLRLLCPNCHSQTETYTFKKTQSDFMNKLKEYLKNYSEDQIKDFFSLYNFSEICALTKTSERSIRKYLKENSKIIPKYKQNANCKKLNISKDELEELLVVKKIPVSILSKQFNISQTVLRRRAKKLGISIPSFYK
jgi:hypothetical protein